MLPCIFSWVTQLIMFRHGTTLLIMVTLVQVSCQVVDYQDVHLGSLPGPPYSLPDLSRFGIISTAPPRRKATLQRDMFVNTISTLSMLEQEKHLQSKDGSTQANISYIHQSFNPSYKFYEETEPIHETVLEVPPYDMHLYFYNEVKFTDTKVPIAKRISIAPGEETPEMLKTSYIPTNSRYLFSQEGNGIERFTLEDVMNPQIEYWNQSPLKQHFQFAKYSIVSKSNQNKKHGPRIKLLVIQGIFIGSLVLIFLTYVLTNISSVTLPRKATEDVFDPFVILENLDQFLQNIINLI